MALGEYRDVLATDINFIADTAMERGGLAFAASGNIVSYPTTITASGSTPVGILLEDIEDLNFMKQPQYFQRNVSDIGSKVGIMTKGQCVTDFIDGYAKVHIDAGDKAYATHSGLLTIRALAPGIVSAAGGSGVGLEVGRFLSSIDSNGFVKVYIDI